MLTPELEKRLVEAKQLGVYTPAFTELPTEFSDNRVRFVVGYFHAKEIYTHELDDDYFMGIRANHFVIEIGVVDYGALGQNVNDVYTFLKEQSRSNKSSLPVVALVTGNHKGARKTTVWLLDEAANYPKSN